MQIKRNFEIAKCLCAFPFMENQKMFDLFIVLKRFTPVIIYVQTKFGERQQKKT
jgi:hypothetical protein